MEAAILARYSHLLMSACENTKLGWGGGGGGGSGVMLPR